MRARVPQLVGLALVAGALLVGLIVVADGIRDRGAVDTVTVTGSAKRQVASDFVVWNASISVEESTTASAVARLDRWVRRTVVVLRQAGIQDAELTVAPVVTERIVGQFGEITFLLTRSLQVRSDRIDAVLSAIAASDRLLAEDVPLTARPPQFTYTKLAALRPALTSRATKDALRRAEAIVKITGGKLGRVIDVSVAPFQVTDPGSTEVDDYGIYDTSTQVKEVTAVVNLTLSVK